MINLCSIVFILIRVADKLEPIPANFGREASSLDWLLANCRGHLDTCALGKSMQACGKHVNATQQVRVLDSTLEPQMS